MMTMIPLPPAPDQCKKREQIVGGDFVVATARLTTGGTEVCSGKLQMTEGGFMVGGHWFAYEDDVTLDRYTFA